MSNADPTGGHVPRHCEDTCSVKGCKDRCGELKGHTGPHLCLSH